MMISPRLKPYPRAKEQCIREGRHLKKIETALGKRRQAEQAKRNQPQSQKVEIFPPLEKADARDAARGEHGIRDAM